MTDYREEQRREHFMRQRQAHLEAIRGAAHWVLRAPSAGPRGTRRYLIAVDQSIVRTTQLESLAKRFGSEREALNFAASNDLHTYEAMRR